MMDGLPAFHVLVVFQQRKIDNPAEGQHTLVDQPCFAPDVQAQVAERLSHDRRLIGDDQNQVAGLVRR